jgi:hypothetical protein
MRNNRRYTTGQLRSLTRHRKPNVGTLIRTFWQSPPTPADVRQYSSQREVS